MMHDAERRAKLILGQPLHTDQQAALLTRPSGPCLDEVVD
jgi:hypothetical protein